MTEPLPLMNCRDLLVEFYSIINNPGKNIKLVYKTPSGNAVYYKPILGTTDSEFYSLVPSTTPYPDLEFLGGQILTRIPNKYNNN
jgi:hypothetical protein